MQNNDEFPDLLDAMHRLIRDADAPARVTDDARSWLSEAGISAEHVDVLSAAGPKRLLLYRKLVRNGLRRAITAQMPRTAAHLGPVFNTWIDTFCTEEMPKSRYLRDAGFEFTHWVLPKWEQDPTIAKYIYDLARHELLAFEIGIASSDKPSSGQTDLSLDKPVLFDPSVRLQRYSYAVHRSSDDETDVEVPTQETSAILGYRDATFEVQFLELSPLAADIIEKLLAGESLERALLDAHEEKSPSHEALQSIAELLANLADLGVVLGAANTPF